ncbi:MAG: DUF4892 domain-containing protein [Gammaproteobacteria bacterium]|nr:DUF4892 domain-containing protein [Gammaproteobacteria bacterium]
MKFSLARLVSVAVLLILSSPSSSQPRDTEGARDHPLVSRFPESVIIRSRSNDFDELLVPMAEAIGIGKFADSQRVEGKVTRLTYEMPKGHSTLEVLQSYRNALVRAGFEILYTCALDECGSHLYFQKLEKPFIIDKDHRFLAAADDLPQGRVYVTARVYTTARENPPVRAMIEIAEVDTLEEGLIQVDAKMMAQAIENTGHIAVYGIYFDTDAAAIKPGSAAALQEMSRLLNTKSDLMVYIVGHTDSTGALGHNMDLSQRRAQAVVDMLLSTYDVEATRLTAKGVGPYAPVASNRTEAGRAKNRRVELVER